MNKISELLTYEHIYSTGKLLNSLHQVASVIALFSGIRTIARMDTIPKDTIPNGNHPEWIQSRVDTIPNGHHPEWIQSRMDTIPNGHHPEWAPSRMGTIPNGCNPE